MRALVRVAAIGGLLTFVPCVVAEPGAESPYRYVITSAKTNHHDGAFPRGGRNLPEIRTGPGSVRQPVLHGGKQEGVELIAIDNGKIVITLIPTRGMGILDVRSGDLRLGWDSP